MRAGLGICIQKERGKKWPTVRWAALDRDGQLSRGRSLAPTTYDEADALRHVCEAVTDAVRSTGATRVLVWTIENNARISNAMRPRLRLEGAVCVAAATTGAATSLVAWAEIASLAGVPANSKASYERADEVCGVRVGDADPYAVLAAVAASKE